jgi:hypothetical protein
MRGATHELPAAPDDVGLERRGTLATDAEEMPLGRGFDVFVAHASGHTELGGDGVALGARPDDPSADEGV